MKRTKKSFTVVLAVVLAFVLALAGCTPAAPAPGPGQQPPAPGGQPAAPADPGVLVLYASTPEDYLNVIVSEFEALTGIRVEVVTAGTGELYNRIAAEGDNPLGDIMLGGMVSSGYIPNIHLWEEYVSPNDEALPPQFRNVTGRVTSFNLVPSALMVNPAVVEGVTINGYADLLNPELRGLVVMPDPIHTSSGWEHLINMLWAMGGGNTDEGWAFVEQLLANDLVMLPGSGAVHRGVADGEYAVGLVAEGMIDPYLEAGLDVLKVFMEEGVIVNVDGVAIIRGARNLANAQKFIDFMISYEFQTVMTEQTPPRRPIRMDVSPGDRLPSTDEITQVAWDPDYVSENRDQMLDRFRDLVTR